MLSKTEYTAYVVQMKNDNQWLDDYTSESQDAAVEYKRVDEILLPKIIQRVIKRVTTITEEVL